MISDLSNFQPAQRSSEGQPNAVTLHESRGSELPAPVVPCGTTAVPAAAQAFGLAIGQGGTPQPVADVPAYLATRTPQPSPWGEEPLLITLPAKVQAEVKALVRACEFCKALVAKKLSVQAACGEALRVFAKWHWKLKTFRAKFDEWLAKRDWIVLVNKAKAPLAWRGGQPQGLPEAFLVLVEQRFAAFAREDGKRQALLSLKRQWQTGRNEAGEPQPVAGYEKNWGQRDTENFPTGWSYSNILTHIKKRARFTAGIRALLHDSTSAAMQHLPQVLGTRKNLRFLEKITFDDVRTDWLIFNTATGQAEEMWVLVARDEATAMVLGFVMLPATVREDGKATHLGAQQMKELAGYLLQTYPLPPYTVHWVVERGTATLAEAVKDALGELFDFRIKVHYTSMIGDKSVRGYKEKAKGNSRGKASHESHNRLFHTQGSWIGGQTGNRWDIRPAELNARCAEAREIYQNAQALPEHLRAQVKYPLPTPAIARDLFKQFCVDQNFRTDHRLEDFQDVLEVFAEGRWVPISSLATDHSSLPLRKRKEMPVERAMRLIRAVEKWERCSPDIIKTFLEHTVRTVTVAAGGEIEITIEGRKLTFAAPAGLPLAPDTRALGYFHPDDPQFLHVTSGDGRILGTWYQRGRTEYRDQAALAQALRYTHAARATATATATELAAPQIAGLAAMRAHNESLQSFTVTGEIPQSEIGNPQSEIARALAGVRGEQQNVKKQERQRAADERIAREALEL